MNGVTCCGQTTLLDFCGLCGKRLQTENQYGAVGLLRHCLHIKKIKERELINASAMLEDEKGRDLYAREVAMPVKLRWKKNAENRVKKWSGWVDWIQEKLDEECKGD